MRCLFVIVTHAIRYNSLLFFGILLQPRESDGLREKFWMLNADLFEAMGKKGSFVH